MNLEKLLEFEEQERDWFLDVSFPGWNGEKDAQEYIRRAFFPKLTSQDYLLLRQETKEGLREGVREFLQRYDSQCQSLYEADLHKFCLDDSIKNLLQSRLKRTKFASERFLPDYCQEICRGYRVFIYNDSSDRFWGEILNAEKAPLVSAVLRASE